MPGIIQFDQPELVSQPVTKWPEGGDPIEHELPNFYYCGRGGYLIENDGEFTLLTNEGQVRQHLLCYGVTGEEATRRLCEIRLNNNVAYAGPVAGYRVGVYTAEDSADRFLVTRSPKIIQASQGSWNFIDDYLTELLGEGQQKEAFLAWLRQARANLLAGERRPLAAAVLIGPRNCGKTLLIDVTRKCLGGRAASGFAYLSGKTNFNGDILGAELLTVDDEVASYDYRTRTAFSQCIKKHLFASSVSIEAKYKDAITMRPVQAVMIAVNDEPEHLQVLPIFDDSTADKLSFFKCSRATLGGLDDRNQIAEKIAQELPAFLHYLETTEHPQHLKEPRQGVLPWHHPDALELLGAISPEERLRELIKECLAIQSEIVKNGFWRGTATELERLLLDDAVTCHAARVLLSWSSACGVYLQRLVGSKKICVTQTKSKGLTRWTIKDAAM
jgi:hypothetical protein